MDGVKFILLSVLFLTPATSERCPPIFGDYECPQLFECKEGQCIDKDLTPSTACSSDVICPSGTVCAEGRCYSQNVIKCNRHVLVAEGKAKSLVSDCGVKGKCVNGQCVLDRCKDVLCEDGEICRDGMCIKILDNFCIGHAECGPSLDCLNNKCQLKKAEAICNCQPYEICHHGQCFANNQCLSVFCEPGTYCVEGQCVNAVGSDCSEESCHGGAVCINNVCAHDPCKSSCPAEQDCRLGQCRYMEGIACQSECKGPYECIDGRCRRNDCSKKVCQLGEACENGSCVRVVGRFCTFAARDCGHAFACIENKCVDLLKAIE
ncbi:unnamed protein product [Auanema sp. JU1783]|nr:unnamed protein product [Auanema sp. JU1783]